MLWVESGSGTGSSNSSESGYGSKNGRKNTFENCNLLIPRPDTDPRTPLNPDPDTQHWFLHKEERSREQNYVKNMIFVITEIK